MPHWKYNATCCAIPERTDRMYIITTNYPPRPLGASGIPFTENMTAATLDEGREACFRAYDAADGSSADLHESIDRLPESGGTIGPLPDGTTITVRPATLTEQIQAALDEYDLAAFIAARLSGASRPH